ncbi:unnamed protein product [Schistosoma margrebowiei]|uniref:Uncharacterized protein n=1 Tax=Schistosoma margrebowiei TaxID=48269 RepID=A0A183M729_9TREM|nr:unnamed protein product [Schistosoma margrebowiei]
MATRQIKSKKAAGPDNVPSETRKSDIEPAAPHLTHPWHYVVVFLSKKKARFSCKAAKTTGNKTRPESYTTIMTVGNKLKTDDEL